MQGVDHPINSVNHKFLTLLQAGNFFTRRLKLTSQSPTFRFKISNAA